MSRLPPLRIPIRGRPYGTGVGVASHQLLSQEFSRSTGKLHRIMHRLVNPTKTFRTLHKTPTVLKAILKGLSQAQIITLRDGTDGWSILFILCHLRDLEEIYTQRVRDLLAQPNPIFRTVSNEALVQQNHYGEQPFESVLDEYCARRTKLITLLETVTEDQWLLSGTHPSQGPATLLDVAMNCGLHDIDHIEQITHCA